MGHKEKNLATVQAVFNLADPYQKKLYEYVVPAGTTNKSDAAKRIFQRDMERERQVAFAASGIEGVEAEIDDSKELMEGLI